MTPSNSPFTAWWQNYEKNYRDGEGLRVVPAKINRDRDTSLAGVAIFIDNRVTLVLTAEHAYKLANGICDTLETLEGNAA